MIKSLKSKIIQVKDKSKSSSVKIIKDIKIRYFDFGPKTAGESRPDQGPIIKDVNSFSFFRFNLGSKIK